MYITYIIHSYNLPENMHYNAYSLYNIMALFIFLFIYLFIYLCSYDLTHKTQTELFLKRRLSVFPQSIHWLIFGP